MRSAAVAAAAVALVVAGCGSAAPERPTAARFTTEIGNPYLPMAPGTRLASNMAPATARSDDGACIAVGSPGADRITTALMQVLGQALLRGVDLAEAIEAPRLHVRFGEDRLPMVEHEPDAAIAAAIGASGLPGSEYPSKHMYFGGVGAAQFARGEVHAAGDSRREASVGTSP